MICFYTFNVYSQSDQLNSDKYWKYRDRLVHDFTLGIGPNIGQSFPFMERQRGINSTNATLKWNDALIGEGYYLAVLATEYKLLANQGLSTDNTVRELFYALQSTINHDYLAETRYYNSSGQLGNSSLNGFFIRDLSTTNMVSNTHYSYYNSNPNLIDVNDLSGGAMDMTSASVSPSAEMSKDQIVYLLVGLRLVYELIPSNVEYVENGTVKSFSHDNNSSLKNEALLIANRIFMYITSHKSWVPIKWRIENPVTNNNVDRGYDFFPLSYPINELFLAFNPNSGNNLYSNSTEASNSALLNAGAKNTLTLAAKSKEVDMQLTLAAISDGWSNTKSVLENNCYSSLPKNATFDYLTLLYAVINNQSLSLNKENYFQALLNIAPINGPYSYNDGTNYTFPTFEWSVSRRYTRPYGRGQNQGSESGDYNGLDYMIIHNLYCLYYNKSSVVGKNKISLRTDMIKNPFNYFGHNYYNIANQMPDVFNHTYTENCTVSHALFINRYMPSEANYYSATNMPVNNSTFVLNLEKPLYNKPIPSMIKSVSNSVVQLGEVIGQKHLNGVINIKNGASLVIANGSTLKMYENSVINVEDGGQLIFENGSNVKLYANSKINVHSGGHLSIGQSAALYLENTQNIIRYFAGAKMCNLYPQISSIIPLHPSLVNNTGYGSIIMDDCATVRCSEELLSTYGTVIWDTETHYFNGTYYISPNSQLTIKNSLIEFGPEGKFVVQAGGRLIIDNSNLKGDVYCDTYWKGIEVWGNEQQKQLPSSNQGFLWVKNNSVIRDADMGVRAMRLKPNGGYDWNSGGGIVRLEDSKFVNNNNSVWLGSYHSPVHSFNLSNIHNCEFELNDNMYYGHDGYAFIGMYDVDRVPISGCSFKNLKTGLDVEDRARGIVAYEAAFNVHAICNDASQSYPATPCNNLEKNYFEGLYYGVYASNSPNASTSVVNIDQADFVNVYHGVHLIGTKNAVVNRCNFQIAESQIGGDVTISYGVFLNGCDGFKVEENAFTKYTDGLDIRGIVIDNSGDNNNEIYKNTFTAIDVSIQAQHNNRGDQSGLKLFCNDMTSTHIDVVVRDEGIGEYQKIANLSGTPQYIPAGDKFTNCTQNTNNWHETNIRNRGGNISFLYDQNVGIEKPNCVTYYHTPNYVTHVHDVEVNDGSNGNAQKCPTKISVGGDDINALQGELATAIVAFNSSNVVLAIWKNGGNANLDDEVETTQPWDVYVEFNHLIAKSPYLSDDVLLATIDNPAFTSLMIKLLMIANPHAKRNEGVMDAIYNRAPAMPPSYIDAINADVSNASQLEILSANVSADKHLVSTISNNIKRVYRMDYDDANAIPNLISFVSAENTLASRYELASLYLETNQYDSMNTVLNAISTSFDLDDMQISSLNSWQTYYSIAKAYNDAGGTNDVLTLVQKSSLENLMNQNRPQISAAAMALLLADNPAYNYHEVVLPIEDGNARMASPFHRTDNEIEVENTLSVFPNPSRDYLTLAYRTGDKYSKLWVVISDARGSMQMQQTLKGGDNEEIIDISQLSANIYTLILYGDGERIDVKKITIIK